MSPQIVKARQEPSLEATVHANAKPVTKALAWSLTATLALALAAAGWRTALGRD